MSRRSATTRNVLGAGEARNRVKLAVERTIPFALLVHTLIVLWYARHGYDPADIDDRRASQPWYRSKTEPAFEDMVIKLRRTLITTRFSGTRPAQPTSDQIRVVLAAWEYLDGCNIRSTGVLLLLIFGSISRRSHR